MSDLQCPARLVVARHGDASYVETWFSDEGGWLTTEGRGQAQGLARRVAEERVAAVWTSDVSRAVQTAEIAAAELGVVVTTRKTLREVFIGELLGQPFSIDALHAVTDRWYAGDLGAAFPGGESGLEVVARYREELQGIADLHRGETVLVVGHQTAACLALLEVSDNVTPAYVHDHPLANGEDAVVEVDADGWRLVRWGARSFG